MREIRFRGRRVDNGEWVYGDLWQYQGRTWMVPVIDREAQRFEIAPETVGQYTGLKDRTGIDIYEGDFVNVFGFRRLQIVKWIPQNARFGLVVHDNGMDFPIPAEDCEVVGNIYEHSHLLKGE